MNKQDKSLKNLEISLKSQGLGSGMKESIQQKIDTIRNNKIVQK